jgi:sugar/nucleoside kinase (ribokinase family)
MSLSGHIQNGVVVFDGANPFPDGTKVSIVPVADEPPTQSRGTGDWSAAALAAQRLRETGYDFDAWQSQRDYDLTHAADHLS